MVFFPSMFRHTAYPFYSSDETRVSISGNLWLNTKNIKQETEKKVIL